MKQSVRVSIISGLVGVMVGASSLYVVQNLDMSARLHSAAEREEISKGIREVQKDGEKNLKVGEPVIGTKVKKTVK